jgi:hypothetical protein
MLTHGVIDNINDIYFHETKLQNLCRSYEDMKGACLNAGAIFVTTGPLGMVRFETKDVKKVNAVTFEPPFFVNVKLPEGCRPIQWSGIRVANPNAKWFSLLELPALAPQEDRAIVAACSAVTIPTLAITPCKRIAAVIELKTFNESPICIPRLTSAPLSSLRPYGSGSPMLCIYMRFQTHMQRCTSNTYDMLYLDQSLPAGVSFEHAAIMM